MALVFATHVAPIFKVRCWKCHAGTEPGSQYLRDTFGRDIGASENASSDCWNGSLNWATRQAWKNGKKIPNPPEAARILAGRLRDDQA